ncbi:helix-turn-helix domain-containing protein [Paenibacillus chibensis]|uniref:helix-turn-helix domain-containing protein n=1 Tax=Paenibacillus chibensis TaxID=59846 RepID=UPI000FD781C0|nr:helix-turn-helix domain-containing protein [Paenibacillus chibensis]MEC0371133.1 helix-turn-helix domain-containing protein [Paenibacillus chibensis]
MDVRDCIERELLNDGIPKYKRNRLLAIRYYLDGTASSEISMRLGVSLRSVQRYIKEFVEVGHDHFLERRPPGNLALLSQSQKDELIQDLGESPTKFGYALTEWTPATLALYIEDKFEVIISLESCRTILRENFYENISSLRSIDSEDVEEMFKREIIQNLTEPETAVWIFGQFYVGYRAAYKTKKKYKRRRAIVLCARQYDVFNTVCHFVSPNRDKKEQWEDIINAAIKKSDQEALFFYLPKSQYTKFVASRFTHIDQKKLYIHYLPDGVSGLHYIQDVKDHILDKLNLPLKNTEEKTLGKRKQKELLSLLDKLSTN